MTNKLEKECILYKQIKMNSTTGMYNFINYNPSKRVYYISFIALIIVKYFFNSFGVDVLKISTRI